MRFFTLDKYNTWHDWRLTLTTKNVAPAEPKTNYIKLDGAHGSLDLSEALTGAVVYNDRTVSASFRTSEGSFSDRVALLREITAALHGKKVRIVEPDDPDHYFLGRCKLKNVEQSQVHVAFTIEATCDPWRYAVNETERRIDVSGDAVDVVLWNEGIKTPCPVLTVTGSVDITTNSVTTTLTAGSYQLTDLRLHPGSNVVGVAGTGSVTFIYREAEL